MNLAELYDLLAPFYRFLIELPIFGLKKEQTAALPYVAGNKILEIGCGTGYLLERLVSSDRSVVGLDISKGMIKRAAKRLHGPKVSLLQGDYYRLPFPVESFDCVVATFTLTHAPDLKPVLEETAKVLVPGGRLIVVDVGPSRTPCIGSRLMTKAWELLGDYVRDETKDLELAGFKIINRRELSKRGTVHLVVAEKSLPPQT